MRAARSLFAVVKRNVKQKTPASLSLAGCLLVGSLAVAADPAVPGPAPAGPPAPASQPATRPAEPSAQMARLWNDLTHRDPAVRDAARVKLMGMRARDLPAFRKLVADTRPMAPSQAAALPEIVTQAFLAGQEYANSTRDGFLGVRPGEVNLSAASARSPVAAPFVPFGQDPPIPDTEAVYGVVIVYRMPGFCGARMLQNGDVILGIVERPTLQLRGPTEFSLAVRAMGAGQTIRFQVLRQGQVIQVPVTLDARPEAADFVPGGMTPMEELLNERDKAVREYWEQEFAPLLNEGIG